VAHDIFSLIAPYFADRASRFALKPSHPHRLFNDRPEPIAASHARLKAIHDSSVYGNVEHLVALIRVIIADATRDLPRELSGAMHAAAVDFVQELLIDNRLAFQFPEIDPALISDPNYAVPLRRQIEEYEPLLAHHEHVLETFGRIASAALSGPTPPSARTPPPSASRSSPSSRTRATWSSRSSPRSSTRTRITLPSRTPAPSGMRSPLSTMPARIKPEPWPTVAAQVGQAVTRKNKWVRVGGRRRRRLAYLIPERIEDVVPAMWCRSAGAPEDARRRGPARPWRRAWSRTGGKASGALQASWVASGALFMCNLAELPPCEETTARKDD
jgi:hypothetical protein